MRGVFFKGNYTVDNLVSFFKYSHEAALSSNPMLSQTHSISKDAAAGRDAAAAAPKTGSACREPACPVRRGKKETFPFCSFHLLDLIAVPFFLPPNLRKSREPQQKKTELRETSGGGLTCAAPSPQGALVASGQNLASY